MSIRATTVALGTGIAAVCAVPLVISVTAHAADDVLLSRGRPALASSTLGRTVPAGNATDVDVRTRWATAAVAGTQWLRVDLGSVQRVDRVKLTWDRAYAGAYRIQSSTDGASWTDLYVTRAGDGGTDDLRRLGGRGRFVRLLATRTGTPAGYALWEMQVYGAGPAVPAAPEVTAVPLPASGLDEPSRREIAFRLVSSAENSTLNWRGQYGYIEDIGDGRGYTAGLIGFCSGTSDMLALVTEYTRRRPANRLAGYLPALRVVDGSDSHAGLDPNFPGDWRAAAADPVFQKAQEDERDRVYFRPSVALARTDGLRTLGQFAYFDAAVMHGVTGLRRIRAQALRLAATPQQGGDETTYLNAFLDMRVRAMRAEQAHEDTSRVDTAQRVFLRAGNLDLDLPLAWRVYGDDFRLAAPR